METKEMENRQITYEMIEKSFREEAGSFLPEEVTEKVLAGEKRKFESADALSISPFRFTGKNISRYTKGLLRKRQPLYILYEFLGFMMEFSVLLLLFLLLYGAVRTVMDSAYHFGGKEEFLYAAVIISGYLLFSRMKTARMGNFLLRCGSGHDFQKISEADEQRLQKKADGLVVLPAILLLIAGACLCLFLYQSGLASKFLMDPFTAFLLYAAFAVLSGLHNVLYGRFFVPYFTIGESILMRKPEEETAELTSRYKMLCYERMLGYKGKKIEDFSKDEVLAYELMQKLRSRMAVYRGTTLLGLFIPLAMILVSLVQVLFLEVSLTVGMIVFELCSAMALLLFLLAFLSANGVIKTLPKK